MFGFGGLSEVLFILFLAMLIFGPEKLPEIGRMLAKGMAEVRKASNELKRTLNAELAASEQEAEARRALEAGAVPPPIAPIPAWSAGQTVPAGQLPEPPAATLAADAAVLAAEAEPAAQSTASPASGALEMETPVAVAAEAEASAEAEAPAAASPPPAAPQAAPPSQAVQEPAEELEPWAAGVVYTPAKASPPATAPPAAPEGSAPAAADGLAPTAPTAAGQESTPHDGQAPAPPAAQDTAAPAAPGAVAPAGADPAEPAVSTASLLQPYGQGRGDDGEHDVLPS